MDECSNLPKANIIRTQLLILINNELSLQTPQQRIKINSVSYQELAGRYEKYVVTENHLISCSPIFHCRKSFFSELENIQNNNPIPDPESPPELLNKPKKITFSKRKLGIYGKSPLEKSNNIISQDCKEIQRNGIKGIRLISKSLKYLYPKTRNHKLMKHNSELNLLQKKLRSQTKKYFDKIYFSLNEKKEIVFKEITTNNNVILLKRCSVTKLEGCSLRKKNQNINGILRTTALNAHFNFEDSNSNSSGS